MATGSDGVKFTASVNSPAAFALLGGEYALTVHSLWIGSPTLTLKILALDGVTLVPVLPAITADAFETLDLPAGTYQFIIPFGSTAILIALQKVAY